MKDKTKIIELEKNNKLLLNEIKEINFNNKNNNLMNNFHKSMSTKIFPLCSSCIRENRCGNAPQFFL